MHDGRKQRAEELLFNAIRTSNAEMAQQAIDLGADVNARNKFGETSLHFAAWNGQPELAKLFIENGADMNAKNDRNETPLQLATKHGHPDVVKVLEDAAKQQQSHAGKIADERKDKGPPQVGG